MVRVLKSKQKSKSKKAIILAHHTSLEWNRFFWRGPCWPFSKYIEQFIFSYARSQWDVSLDKLDWQASLFFRALANTMDAWWTMWAYAWKNKTRWNQHIVTITQASNWPWNSEFRICLRLYVCVFINWNVIVLPCASCQMPREKIGSKCFFFFSHSVENKRVHPPTHATEWSTF